MNNTTRDRLAEALFLQVMSGPALHAVMIPQGVEGARMAYPHDLVRQIAERAIASAHIFVTLQDISNSPINPIPEDSP